MRYLSVKNFAKHQHYKDRRPPWIKLHVEVLDDYHFACLQDASKAHLMLLWVLASKMDNRIPYDLSFLSKKLGATSPVDVEELVLQGFLEVSQDDSKPLASRTQSAMPETETEAERETEGEAPRRNGRKPKALPAPPPWAEPIMGRWSRRVGKVKAATLQRELREAVEEHGEDAVLKAIDAYADERLAANKAGKLEWFASEVALWVQRSAPIVDPITGTLNERGMALFGSKA